jgi:glyoxylase-like metal-dependent hydrolase (beta-lactamase superfamily II)
MTATTTPTDQFAASTDIEALRTAVSWPNSAPRVALLLLTRLLAGRRFTDAHEFFDQLSRERPDEPLLLAAAGTAQAQLPGQLPDALAKLDAAAAAQAGLPSLLRGLTLAQVPDAAGRAADAIADLELVLALAERFPAGLRRAAQHALADLRAGVVSTPPLAVNYSIDDRDGFRFGPPQLVELADGVLVAQNYDFGDIAFIRTSAGVVAVDAGTTEANAAAALAALRAVTADPITHVVLTHAHWDHVGGLAALRGPHTRVIAQAGFPAELARLGEQPDPWSRFRPADAVRDHDITPDLLVSEPTALRVGDRELALLPTPGGETADALLLHLPESGVLFVGDVLMPYLGAPFLAEGSAEGLLAGLRQIEELAPRLLVHGHPPLTDTMSAAVIPALRAALTSLHETVLADLRAGRTLVELLRRNHLPELLRDHPDAVLPYLLVRDNLVQRTHRQRTGYWQRDGEGMAVFAPEDWALALDLLADGDADRHARAVRVLLDRDDAALALRLVDLALVRHRDHPALTDLRQQVLGRLLAHHQSTSPFRFIVYSGLSGVDVPAAPAA